MTDLQIKGLELHMNSIKSGFPPAELTNPERSMWHAMNDNWNIARRTSQSIINESGAWVFAYLHRIAGGLDWYRRANRSPFKYNLQDEAEEIIRYITQI